MAISTNGTVIARLAGGLYNTVMSNATYLEVASQDPSTLANTLYARDFAKSTDLAVAQTLTKNLGLSTVAGLDNWVAAQLTAAGAANKGAKIVSLLNDFAGMTADTTYGASATAFNTKVDAALAASQKTGAAAGVFADAGTVAVTNATFTLTTGADTFTGGSGNNTFNATDLTLGSLDTITGGAAADTLNIVAAASLTTLKADVTGVETLNVTSTGSVGNIASSATIAAKEKVSFDLTGSTLSAITVTVGGVAKALTSATPTTIRDQINTALNEAYGVPTTAYAALDSSLVNKINITAPKAGTALPAITLTAGTGTTLLDAAAKVTDQANSVEAAAVAASTFSAPTGVTSFNVYADGNAFVGAKATTDTVIEAGGVVSLATTKNATISAGDSVSVTGAKGAVSVSTYAPATSMSKIFAATAGGTSTSGAGVAVQGGTTVDITIDQYSAGQNSSTTQVGGAPSNYANTTASTYPYVIGNLSKAPTGNVTVTGVTNYKGTDGKTTAYYGTGAVKVYTNGATAVTVKGAGTGSIIQDVQTQTTTPAAGETDVAGTSTLTTATLAGLSADITVKSDVISNLSVSDTLTTTTVTIGGSSSSKNTGALNLTLSNAGKTGGVVTIDAPNVSSINVSSGSAAVDKIATTSTIDSNAGSASTVTLAAPKATDITFNNSLPVTLSGQTTTNVAKLATIKATGSGSVTLGDVSTLHAAAQKLTLIDASAASGALSASIGATDSVHGLTVLGGTGNDSITLTGAIGNTTTSSGSVVTTTVNLGAGNDKLLSSSGSLTAGAAIDGGDGTDTIAVSLINSSVAGLIKNFETVDVKAGTGTYDMSLYTASAFSGVALSGAMTGATTVTNLAGTNAKVDVTVGSASTSLGDLTVKLASSAGTADTANINFAPTKLTADTVNTFSAVTTTGIETINVSSTSTQATATGAYTAKGVITTLTDTTNATTSIVVTGANDFTLGAYTAGSTNTAATGTTGFAQNTTLAAAGTATASVTAALALIDASASTGVQTIVAGSSSELNGSSILQKYTGLTIKGGSKGDFIINKATSGVVDGGAGDDTITITGTKASAIGGAGADTIYVGGSTQSVDVGADTKVDAVVIGTAAAFTAPYVDGTSSVTSITNAAKGDTINIYNYITTAATANIAKWTTAASSLDGAVAAALADTTNSVDWFNWGSDTYIVVDGSSNDAVIKLVGTYTLSTATATGGVITLG